MSIQYSNLFETNLGSDGTRPIATNGVFPKGSDTQTIVVISNGIGGTTVTAGTGVTLRTVTTGKIFYVKSLTISNSTTGNNVELRDGGSGGTIKGIGRVDTTQGQSWMQTPDGSMSFATSVWLNTGDTMAIQWCITGWEE